MSIGMLVNFTHDFYLKGHRSGLYKLGFISHIKNVMHPSRRFWPPTQKQTNKKSNTNIGIY